VPQGVARGAKEERKQGNQREQEAEAHAEEGRVRERVADERRDRVDCVYF
jgi:hypothetical protein